MPPQTIRILTVHELIRADPLASNERRQLYGYAIDPSAWPYSTEAFPPAPSEDDADGLKPGKPAS
jgi:hypothetical protein